MSAMAVLKKIRTRWWSSAAAPQPAADERAKNGHGASHLHDFPRIAGEQYDVRPLTVTELEECWHLDQRCFHDGEAYSRDTFEYLLTSPDVISYRAITARGLMVGFIVGLLEPDRTGHITTIGVAPEHRRRRLARRLMQQSENAFRRAGVRLIRLEVRSNNEAAQRLYQNLGYAVTQRLPRYYSNGGDGLLMIKSLETN
jgi:ribosomal protein S18 acetylase RimI-like enzyme